VKLFDRSVATGKIAAGLSGAEIYSNTRNKPAEFMVGNNKDIIEK
jgi:hypothetical protein